MNVNGNNWNDNNGYAFGMALALRPNMAKTYNNLYKKIFTPKNLNLAWKNARKGKTKKNYVLEFETSLRKNLTKLKEELENLTYKPEQLKTFILRDPKTRKISKSAFPDRIVHHALIQIIEPIFGTTFIYDSCANQKGKCNLFALKRFEQFVRKISQNGKTNGTFTHNQIKGYCLKADIKHYFEKVNHKILVKILSKKIKDENIIGLIKKIVANSETKRERES
ncbi:MAG: hypothetical protein AABW79_04570 [Nanoarchaeota archaeon]